MLAGLEFNYAQPLFFPNLVYLQSESVSE